MPFCDMLPLRRLAVSLDILADTSLLDRFSRFLDDYEAFLTWKEHSDVETQAQQGEFKLEARRTADRFSDFLFDVVTHTRIPKARRKYLVI